MKKEKARFGRRAPVQISYQAMLVALGVGLVAAQVQAQEAAQPSATSQVQAAQDDNDGTETVIVTGVLGSSKAKKANVSYSVLSEDDMSKFTPISADDMLRDMPGVVVESNDGVARNEVFTRGMTIGTGFNTSGYFWTTILEDGLPVAPFKFGGFQDGYFNRADIGTNRVEAVRGGSSATAVTTSIGATFNFLSGKIRPGAEVQTRIGFEGEDLHLSWRQVDGYYGWLNDQGDFGYALSGFYRKSNGQVDPGYDLNHGGQLKLNLYKSYENDGGSGTVNVVLKHLDDTNAEMTTFFQPAYGYEDAEAIPGFSRDVDLFMHGGKQTVPNFFRPGTHEFDPSEGYQYKQDALSVRWEHITNGKWGFNAQARVQKTSVRGQAYKPQDLVSLNAPGAARERFGLDINNLDRTPGYYEFYNSDGVLQARIANNVAGSQLGTNYRTGQACPVVASPTAAGRCITYNILPNRDIDVRGGLVTATIPNPDGTFNSGIVPNTGNPTDLVLQTRAEDTYRESRDLMANFTANYTGETYMVNMGLYVARSEQINDNWGNGLGVSAWADGQVQNLDVRYVTSTGTTYQLTDEGGWGSYGSGAFTTLTQRAKILEVSPFIGFSWSPNEHWDFNASVKHSRFKAKTYSETWDSRAPGSSTLTYGGLDGNPLTVYDNVTFVQTPAKVIEANREVSITNYSASIGYNFSAKQKVYYRYMDGKQPANGVVQRYSTIPTLARPLGPTAYVKGHEIAYTFGDREFNGQITSFYQNFAVNDYPVATDTDNVSTYLLPENFNRYFTRGVEAWAKWRITRNLEWMSSATYLNGKASEVYNWLNTGANGQGAADDFLRVDSGILARSPKWTLSNTLSYKYDDFRFNLRHRWMDVRKLNTNALDKRYLPEQDNLDVSVQYEGIKKARITLDVRNVLDTQYISAYDPMIKTGYPANVQQYDVVNQLPDAGFLLKRNSPRSFWLTIKYDL